VIQEAAGADIGVSGVDYALADTGTLVLVARNGQPRSVSLLPPVHIAVVRPEQVLSGLSDLFPILRSEAAGGDLSSAITFITGPSRTADIELTLVVGVHGPQQLHVVLLET
jgi:L-lactate dehydrogenase complex protein LldG